MTFAGVVALDVLAAAFVAWILILVSRGRLYVGYGVILVAAFAALGTIASVPGLRRSIHGLLERLFGPWGPLVVALSFVALLLVYILTQVTIVSNRLVTVVQDLAIREAIDGGAISSPDADARRRSLRRKG